MIDTGLLVGVRVLLLDFDGPVCRVFAGLPAPTVAARLRGILAHRIGGLPAEDDPLQILRLTAGLGDPELTDEVSRALREAELLAVTSAVETPHAREVVTEGERAGYRLGIVSNNSPEAIARYLRRIDLACSVAGIVGRDVGLEPAKLKPSPYLLHLALAETGVTAAEALFVGDSVTDVEAGRAAGVRVVGYANRPGKRDLLARAGADAVVDSMADVAHAIRQTGAGHPCSGTDGGGRGSS